jgi:SET domain-containing protein
MYLNELLFSEKLIVRRSKIHRWGVFARQPISKYEILEESPYFKVSTEEINSIKGCTEYSYVFDDKFSIIGMGFCGLYNHNSNPNVDFEIDKVNEVMRHYAITDINVGDELTLDYGEENASHFNVE